MDDFEGFDAGLPEDFVTADNHQPQLNLDQSTWEGWINSIVLYAGNVLPL